MQSFKNGNFNHFPIIIINSMFPICCILYSVTKMCKLYKIMKCVYSIFEVTIFLTKNNCPGKSFEQWLSAAIFYNLLCIKIMQSIRWDCDIFQKWLNSLNDHIAYSTYYTNKGCNYVDEDVEDLLPLGSMQDALQVSRARGDFSPVWVCWRSVQINFTGTILLIP